MNRRRRTASGRPKTPTLETPAQAREVRLGVAAPAGQVVKEEQCEFTDQERDLVLRSVIASEALEGFTVPYELASRLMDQVLQEPVLDLD